MLSSFYNSKDWIELMEIIRMQRVNDDGYNVCEHCGKPIVNAYDCIGHHVIELTEENYQNAAISLNPDNIMLVHHRCHNKIHDRLGLSRVKQVYLVYGSPLSGKTSYVRKSMNYGDIVVDIDNIWECISGQERCVKPNRLKQNVFGIRNELIRMIRMRQGNWLNAYVIGGYPLISERERLIKSLGAREIFIDTPKEVCIQRLENRPKEYEQYIQDWWEKYGLPPQAKSFDLSEGLS